jgi:hypothetical protein
MQSATAAADLRGKGDATRDREDSVSSARCTYLATNAVGATGSPCALLATMVHNCRRGDMMDGLSGKENRG